MRNTIAVVSPFLDKRHGTERCVCEQIEHLAHDYGYEVHVYSPRVEDIADIELYSPARYRTRNTAQRSIWWHRVPDIPGPGLLKYLWWFGANHLWRGVDRYGRGLRYDLVFSPGINCLDADVIAVHIVFAEFYHLVKDSLRLRVNPLRTWPWLLHRWLYYQLIISIEYMVYTHNTVMLTAVSHKTVLDLHRFYAADTHMPVLYHGLAAEQFTPQARERWRAAARQSIGLPDTACALLLVGNDWKKKGLRTLLEALGKLQQTDLWLLVVGQDRTEPYEQMIAQYGVQQRVCFLPLRPDVEWYYAAADVYVGPSLEDAFALPPAEAMACGVPAIVSSQAGVSEIVSHGADAFILQDPTDANELAGYIQQLYADHHLRQWMGEQAARTAQTYTWERNAVKLHMVFQEVMLRKAKS